MNELVGWLAGALTTVSWIPQILHIIKHKSAHSVSWGMPSIFATGIFLWICYGVIRKDPVIIFINVITLVLTLAVMFAKWYYDHYCVKNKPQAQKGVE